MLKKMLKKYHRPNITPSTAVWPIPPSSSEEGDEAAEEEPARGAGRGRRTDITKGPARSVRSVGKALPFLLAARKEEDGVLVGLDGHAAGPRAPTALATLRAPPWVKVVGAIIIGTGSGSGSVAGLGAPLSALKRPLNQPYLVLAKRRSEIRVAQSQRLSAEVTLRQARGARGRIGQGNRAAMRVERGTMDRKKQVGATDAHRSARPMDTSPIYIPGAAAGAGEAMDGGQSVDMRGGCPGFVHPERRWDTL